MDVQMQPPKVRLEMAHVLRANCCRMIQRFLQLAKDGVDAFEASTATKSPLIAVLDVARWRRHLKPDSVVFADTTGTESIKKAKVAPPIAAKPAIDSRLDLYT